MCGLTPEQQALAQTYVLDPAQWSARVRPRPVWFMACLDEVIANNLSDPRLQFPAFPNTRDIAIFSDYGGEHSESPVLTYCFLIVDFGALGTFERAVQEIRRDHGLGSREISFKELNSTAIRAAVPRLMRAADQLPGLLFTLVVSKKYKTILGTDTALTNARQQLDAANIMSWRKPKELEGVVRKVHTVAYWLSMLAREGMGVFWLTDNDNIVANQGAIEDLRSISPLQSSHGCRRALSGYAASGCAANSTRLLISLP